jgi:hypothetical protein
VTNPEQQRLVDDYEAWTAWGPYVAERAWGTVREDYSADGDAWSAFTYDDARSRTYRWNEDGLFGFSDRDQRWCLSLALWNGRDPHLKERLFGLDGHEGNHGEDAKEEWWYLDATPTHSWGRAAYAYPRSEFPYAELREENSARGRLDPEYELLDTSAFDSGWWDVQVDHAKAAPDDLCLEITVTNHSSERDTIHLLPTMWFRNRWSWGRGEAAKPSLHAADHGGITLEESDTGRLELTCTPGAKVLVCENETNRPLVHGQPASTPFPKDGINDHVIGGEPTVNPDGQGTKAALWYELTVDAGQSESIRVRLSPEARSVDDAGSIFERRQHEADTFFGGVISQEMSQERRSITRQALAGLLFSKQWYHFDVDQWLDGDPASEPPPASRLNGRNVRWRHLNNADVIAMPDTWEYPWYAAWDTAFHCLPFTLVDPTFAKNQLTLLGREWYQHPNGQLPAYEWSFSDVNPPVQAWAALRVFELDGGWDTHFLERVLHKLMLNFTWWVNRRDADENNVFDGGFLGLDNIGPFNRSAGLGTGRLEQADATAWMAMYSLDLLDMSLRLTSDRPSYEDLATKFAEHFAYIATAMDEHDLWHETDGFYYDKLRLDDASIPIAVRSMVGLIPIFATRIVSAGNLDRLPEFKGHLDWFRENKPEFTEHMRENDDGDVLMSLVSPERLVRLLQAVLDEDEFLSDFGVRGLSKVHADKPYRLSVGDREFTVGYEPGESESALFGGNSNWRGPVWFPLNYLLIESLRRFDYWAGGSLMVEFPKGSGEQLSVGAIADLLGERLASLFEVDERGRRPALPTHENYQKDGVWHDRILFHEYFHGDTGRGMGGSHQTGWTALVASLMTNSAAPLGRRHRTR